MSIEASSPASSVGAAAYLPGRLRHLSPLACVCLVHRTSRGGSASCVGPFAPVRGATMAAADCCRRPAPHLAARLAQGTPTALPGEGVRPSPHPPVASTPVWSGWHRASSRMALSPARRTPRMRFVYLGSGLCLPLPSDPASRRRPCGSAGGSCHQGPQRTFTSKSTRHAWRTMQKGSGPDPDPLPRTVSRMVRLEGFEPTTRGLRIRCSAG